MFKPRTAKTAKTTDVWAKDATLPAALSYIGAGAELRGDLRAAGNVRIDGAVIGTLQVDGDLEVSVTGSIEGERVVARNVLVHGRIKAQVRAAEHLRIHGQGRVEGDVTAQSLDIEAGAHFIGYSRTGADQDMQEAQILQLERAASGESRS